MKNQCRICGRSKGTFLLEKTRGTFKSAWVLCAHCKSAHIDPYPTEEELMNYYNSSYTEMDLSGGMDTGVNHKLRFSEGYRLNVFREYSYSLADVGCEPSKLMKSGDILDYGCANGVFLDFLSAEGVPKEKLHGFDVGTDMISIASKKGYKCTTNTKELLNGKYSLITLWDVLEHVLYPKEVVKHIKSLLKKNGDVVIQTPRFDELAILLKEAFAHYLAVEHLHLFSRNALLTLFENEGFECIAQSSFGANAYKKYVPEPYKTAYDRLAKKYDFGATQVLHFRLTN
ncbi:MAG: class I SAM-dependent methyltransferase [Candidatus Gracilibacteria bacterium]|jgi:2-polyprenyl-3-methyl-5-hydroxy-6-metoxy-1,4-benzoquinol methylase